jgi:hypothetical protein
LLLIAPPSAAAKLFARGMQLDFAGVLQYLVPHVSTHPVPLFVAEGAPIPVVQGATSKATVGPVKKLAFAFAISNAIKPNGKVMRCSITNFSSSMRLGRKHA